ncbi:hypothetical protein COO60DRAFT_1485425 [Scenedesmus sp. NREL 46B-D3]|nr:hypothetical protein COO60DRAFT_1485425 [Scenedesmus sp. NREL 46B-D3]
MQPLTVQAPASGSCVVLVMLKPNLRLLFAAFSSIRSSSCIAACKNPFGGQGLHQGSLLHELQLLCSCGLCMHARCMWRHGGLAPSCPSSRGGIAYLSTHLGLHQAPARVDIVISISASCCVVQMHRMATPPHAQQLLLQAQHYPMNTEWSAASACCRSRGL